ncbi:conserved hypothetical protein [Desulfofarcimen acetoxidans DSM 771]|uniref:DUF2326 domain-containing protein n=1 Tax=Desulfofarcimen acetoxidans (strain ATCC 49208 / DSM 771 / KCTC 5769 / VKM B-1644 / 5575) TaxID=485916 RepID=C8W4L4_DESAS|nr:DUF2326 domain-containing protein [Desulfofarcimen acetoxidans]ACV63900.1 conserved hypothetical protein [Desulfofarcimen acetoxidans DSM 771]
MYLKRLVISSPTKLIRNIEFKLGMNLIVDDTPVDDIKSTGNNVGKTTVLKLVDFCLGAKPNIIYTDTENRKEVYDVVKNFVIDEKIEITLTLTDSLSTSCGREVEIRRNFLSRKNAVREINGGPVLDKDFEDELERHIMPDKEVEKPTFRQVISHNIRYKDDNINNTLKTLDKYTTDVEYETLYLYLLGCSFGDGAWKQALITMINQENAFRERLEQNRDKTTYEIALSMIDDDIAMLNEKKALFNLNENFEQDMEQLNSIKYKINKNSSLISKIEIRKNLIEESVQELKQSQSSIDLLQLKILYNEVNMNISGIQKTFEDLVTYHNKMLVEKSRFISKELPELTDNLKHAQQELALLLQQEKELSSKISKSDSFEELEEIIISLNEKYRTKGEYESIISQVNEVENNIAKLNEKIEKIDKYLFSNDFEDLLKEQIKKFNKFFSKISQELYGEKYALTYKKDINKKGQQVYKFNAFNANMSSGKKQGEILCFDLAYTMFADEENIPCLHFLLNDKKELMHDNQLIKVAEFVRDNNTQLVLSILKDKLPEQALNTAHIAVELSQKDKLFRIETMDN